MQHSFKCITTDVWLRLCFSFFIERKWWQRSITFNITLQRKLLFSNRLTSFLCETLQNTFLIVISLRFSSLIVYFHHFIISLISFVSVDWEIIFNVMTIFVDWYINLWTDCWQKTKMMMWSDNMWCWEFILLM